MHYGLKGMEKFSEKKANFFMILAAAAAARARVLGRQ